MNNTNLTQYRVPFGTDLWHKFRTVGINEEESKSLGCKPYSGGIGASEIGALLGLTKNYRPCPAETFHYKVGSLTPTQNANRAMLRGKILEPIVKDVWTLYQGEGDESWVQSMEDYQNGDRATREMLAVRKARKMNAYFVNNDYPWLFSSLDYFAEKGTMGLLPGPGGLPQKFEEGFPVEIKTINQNYARLWLEGVPPYHICQLNQEMICTNSNYGEIAVLFPDDFSFKVFPFYKDEDLCNRIIHWSRKFWDKVIQSRKAKVYMDKYYAQGDINKGEEMQAIIDSNEPEPDDGEAYNEYIREKYKQIIPSTEGSIELYNDTMTYKVCAGINGLLEDKQRYVKNKILKILEATGAEIIDFEALGKITYAANKNGNRTLRIDTKSLCAMNKKCEDEFSKLDLIIQ